MYERLTAAIKEMRDIDQELRFSAGSGKGPYNYLIYATDLAHGYRIRRLIEEFGYPTEVKVGAERLKDFWLVVQHQDADLLLQKDCLERCGFAAEERAYLTDRVCVNSGEPQVYGTQLQRGPDGRRFPRPIQDEENVDERRRGVGLMPLRQYLDEANRNA
jgi:hypothetical protein